MGLRSPLYVFYQHKIGIIADGSLDQYGIFKQLLSNSGEQLEAPDPWLDRESVSGTLMLLIC